VIDELVIEAPPLVNFTAMLYVPVLDGVTVNKNDTELTVVAAGVVNVAAGVNVSV